MKYADVGSKQKYNRKIIFFIFLFTLLSGGIRKWIVDSPEINLLITAIQVPILFLFLFLRPNQNQFLRADFGKLLGFYFFYLSLTAFNPIIPTFYHGIAGIIIHIGFWLALFIYISNYSAFQTGNLENLILIFLLSESVLAIIQYQLPPDSFLNRYAGGEAADDYFIAQVGNAARVTGTFSYLSGFTGFILFFQLFVFAVFIKNKNAVQFNVLSVVGILLALISGSRASVFIYFILFLSFIIFQVHKNQLKRIFLPLVAIPFCFFLLNFIVDDPFHIKSFTNDAYLNFDLRIEDAGEESRQRVLTPFLVIFNYDLPNIIWGNGLGITYPAVNELFGTASVVSQYGGQDDEVTRTIIEGGYILLILKFSLIFLAVTNLSLNKKFASIMFIIVFLYVPLSTNVYNAVFFLTGLIFLDAAIRKKNQCSSKND